MKPVQLDPKGYYRRIPLTPELMVDRITRSADAIVLCHLGVPRLAADDWVLTIDGMVAKPMTLRLKDILKFPKTVIASFHQCAGSPLQPFEPTRRICNVHWGGVRLVNVLETCRPDPAATFAWSYGADGGEFAGVAVDAYLKDLPVSRIDADVLLAYELNGAPLPPEHGYPVRLVVPGFYGTNSVKWLTRLNFTDRRAAGPFTTRWYNDPVLDASGQPTNETTPVWSVAPESLIVRPAPDQHVTTATETEIWGWAWADNGVQEVKISTDGGQSWRAAEVEPPRERAWQRFSLPWRPAATGAITLASRATAVDGRCQPENGQRNAVYRVTVRVTD